MAKTREVYVCSACGAESVVWRGQCPSCQAWNTLSRFREAPAQGALSTSRDAQAIRLEDVSWDSSATCSTGNPPLDHVLGQGLVRGGAYLISGEPGIGKSTLLMQIAGTLARQGSTVLYCSGEEALPQLKARAERLDMLSDRLLALATSRVEDILEELARHKPALVVIDSVQTIASTQAEGIMGNVAQIRSVTAELITCCRSLNVTMILVGHVTKDGVLAGPRVLEHMVDCVLALEGDRRQMFRLLRVFKNRFGANDELLVFQMVQKGLEVVPDPSTFFLEARDPRLAGAAVVMAVDGQRPLAVEVQALCCRSYLSIPRRTALGFDVNRLHLLLAVLEKSLKLSFAQVDIYAKIGGGIRLQEPGMDLALVAAVLSSFYATPVPEKSIFWGEVDLSGQVRAVSRHAQRFSQAKRLGFTPIIAPVSRETGGGMSTVAALQREIFHRS